MSSLYELGFPTLISVLNAQKELLKKTQAYAAEKGISTSELVEARLYEDMYPLATQVVVTAATAGNTVTQLTGKEVAPLEKRDLTLDECLAVLDETLKVVEAVTPEAVTVRESDTVVLKTAPQDFRLRADAFVQEYAIPNLFFHLNMSYAILRMKGVPLGKLDYLKGFWRKSKPVFEKAAAERAAAAAAAEKASS
ncbi:hypothetical protein F4775DRAFT_575596 [Biscogniauxia sp. FL1348]|nr:hypothetical protein F4775DRAFT_575596 [Biscogniauxia sp. FL1348]